MELETDLLADLIARKHACLVGLREMGRLQMELVRLGEITRLLDLLATKQKAMAELQRIERALAPFRGQDPDGRHWRTPDARAACARQLSECEALLGEIVEREKRSEREMVRRRDEAAARLQGAHAASQARGAYTATPGAEGSRLDLLSDT
jgi:hypothetical protein